MMKQVKLTFLLMISLFVISQPLYGMVETKIPANSIAIKQQKVALKSEFKIQKKVSKFEKFFKKSSIDVKDPVKKWLWFALGFGIASIVLSIFFGGVLAGIAWSAAGVCLIIWLLKYLDII